jgi:hypothetical protein
MTEVISIIQPKKPISPAWQQLKDGVNLGTGYANVFWYHPKYKILVISAVEVAEAAIGPQYHISMTKGRPGNVKRCSADEARFVQAQFGMQDALEDNHRILTRNFWMPVAEDKRGIDCACKADEAAVTDGDFTWRPLTAGNLEHALQAALTIPSMNNK